MNGRFQRIFLLGFTLFMIFSGCAPVGKSAVWKDDGYHFSEGTTFRILPVENASEKTIKKDTLAALTGALENAFLGNMLMLQKKSPPTGETLRVRTELLAYGIYKPRGSNMSWWQAAAGRSMCTLRTSLINRKGVVIARIITTQETGAAVYSPSSTSDFKIAKAAAEKIASHVAAMIQSKNGP